MSRLLILARHAEASGGRPDIDRPLTPRGLDDASLMAMRLTTEVTAPQLLLASPAARAWATAQIYGKAFDLTPHPESRIYEASLTTLLYRIDEAFESHHSVMIVGHNPALSEAVAYFDVTFRETLPPAGVAILELDKPIQAGGGRCVATLYPEE